MAKIVTVIPSSMHFKDVGAATSGDGTAIEGVSASLNWTREDGTTTTVEDQFSDYPLYEVTKLGKVSFSFDITDIDYEVLAELQGGTYDDVADTYVPPILSTTIYKKFLIKFSQGMNILVYKGKIDIKEVGDDLKNTPFKYTATVTCFLDTETTPGTTLPPYKKYVTSPTSW